MEIAYWIVAALLALFYLYAGGVKIVRDREGLRPMMGWVERTPVTVVKLIGVAEVLGAAGLVLPPLIGIAPTLAVLAAAGLAAIQVGGIAVHVARGEFRELGLNVTLLAAAVAAGWLAVIVF
ncbi:DoxX family protein [Nocardia sp. NPDC050697]|uniref:DoxX family protein n=1 Tax=Nocardia sp. NPDC050697 TaxID=3155158 RepID=UPI0033CA72DA